ncbi:MAG: hypothetical protein NT127_06980 [Sphingobacteriales bacterium]|nr:hypothetical protein [Sphingobacteriales bacterium]
MIRILFFISFCFIGISTNAQTKDSIIRYPIVIQFQSVCCGVPSETPLISFLKTFKRNNKIKKITAFKIGPLGREGEYNVGFKLTELNRAQKKSFIKKLKLLVPKLNDKGMAVLNETVTINRNEFPANVTIERVNY